MRSRGPPVPRLTLVRYSSTLADNTRPSATGQRFIAAASRNELTTIARTANPKPPITSATTPDDAFRCPARQVPRFIGPRRAVAQSLPIGEAARLPNSHLDWGAHAARVLAMVASPSRTFVFPLSPLQFAAGRMEPRGRERHRWVK